MAGYIIRSLDWNKFNKFVEEPTRPQLIAFAELLSDGLDEYDEEFDEGDPVAEWPSEPEELYEIAQERLKRPEWYGDLSNEGKSIWERAVTGFCDDARPKDVGFRRESDGVYWDVIDIARRHHGIPENRITRAVLSHFGTRPYRFRPSAKYARWDDWTPYHSMHTPDEVQQLLKELEAAGPAIEQANQPGACSDYENELMPALDKVVSQGRMLYIGVDT